MSFLGFQKERDEMTEPTQLLEEFANALTQPKLANVEEPALKEALENT